MTNAGKQITNALKFPVKLIAGKLLLIALYIATVSGMTLMPSVSLTASAACGQNSVLGIPTWHKYLEDETVAGKCTPKLRSGNEDNPEETANLLIPIGVAVLEMLATLGAIVALVMVLWGSFNFVTSIGESDKAASARKTVQNAAIGLVLLLISSRVIAFFGGLLS